MTTNRYKLIGMIHHSDQQVEENDDVDDSIRAEHQHAPEPREDLDAVQLERVQVDQTERRPEQRLHRLEQTVMLLIICYYTYTIQTPFNVEIT